MNRPADRPDREKPVRPDMPPPEDQYYPHHHVPHRPRRGFHPLRFLRTLLLLLLCILLGYGALRYGPAIYQRLFGSGNTTWVSERFSEELKAQNELVVYQTTLTGQETVSQEAWLLGTVQKVSIPYSFTIHFTVDMNLAQVSVDTATGDIVVRLPKPVASYAKLTVDEDNMEKVDWLYPLTPERYAEIKNEIEQNLYDECASKQEYLDAAWESTVGNIQTLFQNVLTANESTITSAVNVIMDETLTQADTLSGTEAITDTTPTPDSE